MKVRKIIQTYFVGIVFALGIAAPLTAIAAPQPVFAADCEPRFLGIPPWFRGMTQEIDGKCSIISPEAGENGEGVSNFIWKIVLNIIEIVLVLVGYIAFFLILFGGFQFMTGGSNPGQIEKARKTILNAVIGLAIALGAIGITNLIFGILG